MNCAIWRVRCIVSKALIDRDLLLKLHQIVQILHLQERRLRGQFTSLPEIRDAGKQLQADRRLPEQFTFSPEIRNA